MRHSSVFSKRAAQRYSYRPAAPQPSSRNPSIPCLTTGSTAVSLTCTNNNEAGSRNNGFRTRSMRVHFHGKVVITPGVVSRSPRHRARINKITNEEPVRPWRANDPTPADSRRSRLSSAATPSKVRHHHYTQRVNLYAPERCRRPSLHSLRRENAIFVAVTLPVRHTCVKLSCKVI